MTNYIPGKITEVKRTDYAVVVTFETSPDTYQSLNFTAGDSDALWAVGEYWKALHECGGSVLNELEDEMRDMGLWQDDEDDD